MSTRPKLDKLINSWKEQRVADRAGLGPAPELFRYQQQILRALAQGAPWEGGPLPLSFQPSPYRVRVNESNFFALSALACLQLPALLGEAVEVISLCPSNGSAIHLTITEHGVTSQAPPGCVMSVALTGQSAPNGAGSQAERQNLARQLTRFFSSFEAASLWLVAYPKVEILQLDQAWRLAIELTGRPDQPDHPETSPFID